MSASHGDYVIWQRRTNALLGKFIDRCYLEGLPVIHWSVGMISNLAGKCMDPDMVMRRAEFEAWVRALDLERRPEQSRDGSTRLTAVRRVERVDVVVTAEIYTDEEGR
ncbi:MAG: hypothetical protein ACRDP6_36385 [Actinoallomurus sp.]